MMIAFNFELHNPTLFHPYTLQNVCCAYVNNEAKKMSEWQDEVASLKRKNYQTCGMDIDHTGGEYDFSLI
jgi:hypothetical protein